MWGNKAGMVILLGMKKELNILAKGLNKVFSIERLSIENQASA
jgi:hypothetical protein